ncbi:MAG: IS1634 family transposase [Thermoflexales bacterium]|nr:IS1634 family transposase [Thermoflexales bacterium]
MAEGYATQRLDHLGIVAGICQEIGLAEQIDRIVGPTERQVSVGEAVQAMVLNALGFTSRPLYLTPEFFAHKPLDRLLRPGLTAEMLNDDSLGRALDILHERGETEIFAQVASHALRVYGISHRFVHLDTTSLSVEGEYDRPDEPGVIRITHGYSRDHRPDLKQVVVALLTTYRSALPTWIQALDGNTNDSRAFPQIVAAYLAQMGEGEMPYLVADSALYSEENLQRLSEVKWLTRVPERIGLAKGLIEAVSAEQMQPATQEGYRYLELCTVYGGVRQRWLVVWSAQAEAREGAALRERVEKEKREAERVWQALCRREFPTAEEAEGAVREQEKRWRYHRVEGRLQRVAHYAQRGRPAAGAIPQRVGYRWEGEVMEKAEAVAAAQRGLGKFILATNELDEGALPAEEMLGAYKGQGVGPERGFRFLKDPWFFADSLFLKSPGRIMALVMVMGLALLVYALAERKPRRALQEGEESIPDQVGKPTQRPTMRRVFQMFEGIDVLLIPTAGGVQQRVLNLQPVHRQILRLLGPYVEKCYQDTG